jgi:hypothetical protein
MEGRRVAQNAFVWQNRPLGRRTVCAYGFKWFFIKQEEAWTGLIWLRIGTGAGLL